MIICGVDQPQQRDAIEIYPEIFCLECGGLHNIEICPECGSFISFGFGLNGGGYGSYKICNDVCGWIFKKQEPDE